MTKLSVKNLTKTYNKKIIIKDITFSIQNGEFVSILGSSGCGKTTLLKILIGIENPDSGEIIKDGESITKKEPSKRQMGIVFQDYALFPNMNVLENVMYALNNKLKNKKQAEEEALKMLKLVKMEEHIKKYPHELSGGQKQRVAIARTLVLKPDIILFDEPMSALDAENRLSLQKEIKKLQKDLKTTIIYVTHDQEEAFSLSDKVIVMKDGQIQQVGTPSEIFHTPKNEYIKTFITKQLKEKVKLLRNSIGDVI